MIAALLLGAAAAAPLAAPAAGADPPALEAVRLEPGERIRLDGLLDEDVWRRAPAADAFRQQEPREGEPAAQPTEVRVLYDRDQLYIGVLLHDSEPEGIIGNQLRRDAGLGSDDRFMWILDTFLDGRTAYFFEINPAGMMGDGLMQGTGGVNKAWDGIWEARVRRVPEGWSAEIRIPFSTLNFDPRLTAWGINFQRTVRRTGEETLWSGHGRNQGLLRPAHAGRLTGLRDISQGMGVEARPYVTASHGRGVGGPAAAAGDLGLDLNYSVTPGLRASLTLNTDFAEVEVDQRRVELSRFPTSFPERRDFFLEGSGVWSFTPSSGPSPYFSRRIGLVGGTPVPIRAGGRLTGQAGAYELGFLQVRTGAAELPGVGTAPAEDFTIARVKRRLFRQSSLGAVYTRRAAAGADSGALALPHGHTAGVDLDLVTSRFLGDRNLQLEAFLVWHTDPHGRDATTFGDRSARGFRLTHADALWPMHVSLREFGDAYDPPVGFVPRRGFRRLQPTVGWTPRPARWERVRQFDFSWNLAHLTDLEGRLLSWSNGWTLLGARLTSGDQLSLRRTHSFERLDAPFRIRRGAAPDGSEDVVVPVGDYTNWGWEASARTAGQRTLAANGSASIGEFWSGSRTHLRGGVELRPRAGVELGVEYERNDVRLAEGAFATNLARLAAGWHLSPWASATASAQYDDVSRTLGTFARFRWIVRPGNEVYLVYAHDFAEDPTSLERFRGLTTLDRRATTKLTYTHRF
jgi:hypothetical protein